MNHDNQANDRERLHKHAGGDWFLGQFIRRRFLPFFIMEKRGRDKIKGSKGIVTIVNKHKTIVTTLCRLQKPDFMSKDTNAKSKTPAGFKRY